MKICIIGAGVSGILLSLLLHQAGISTNDVCLIDPHFDGGALQRDWPNVISNTTWNATIDAIRRCIPSLDIPAWAKQLPPDQPTPLRVIAKLIRELFAPLNFKTIRGHVHQVSWNSEKSTWSCAVQSGNGITEINCTKLLFAQGSIPKQYDMPIQSIPLDIALDLNRLQAYLDPKLEHVVVFGTNHSGTLVLKNLVDCAVKRVVGVYKGTVPFIWARDGEYDGLKLEGAAIADSVVQGKYPTISLVSYNNVSEIVKETRQATWVVYAAGFMTDTAIRVVVDGVETAFTEYDPNTGVLKNTPNAWGFGIAYPSQAPDGIHFDVGISPFLEHFYKEIPTIIADL